MTYLDMVNNILRRLREREVSTVNETAYSTMLSMLINDAKDEVENAWQWSALRTTITATTTNNIFSYSLTGSDQVLTTLEVINDTDDWFMEYATAHQMNQWYIDSANAETGSPQYYSYNGVDANGDTIVDLYPKPDGAYTIRFNIVKRTSALVNDTDTNALPDHPILLLAYAKAVEERGEDGGILSGPAYATAQKHLSDYIALDAAKHPEELIWATV
jgi:hypothetical protein